MNFIPLMSPNITEDDVNAAVAVLRSGMLVQGENVEALEHAVSGYLGVRNVIAVSSGTATLHLALVALGIKASDEVIVPAFSHVATANVVELVGATPVFVDVDENTFNIDVSKIESAITPLTRAILPVHEFGLACDISEIVEIASRRELFVIEDAACALGATENGKFVGTFGTVSSFSLHPRKAITSGEGGLLATDNDKLAARLRVLRNHGIEMVDGKQVFVAAGFNYRMTDFQAALVLSQFGRFDENLSRKFEIADLYVSELSGLKGICLPFVPADKRHTWQTFHVIVDEKHDRDELIEKLKSNRIGTNYGAQCIPAVEYYQEKYGLDCDRQFPNAMRAFQHGLALPLYEKLSFDEARFVTRMLREALN